MSQCYKREREPCLEHSIIGALNSFRASDLGFRASGSERRSGSALKTAILSMRWATCIYKPQNAPNFRRVGLAGGCRGTGSIEDRCHPRGGRQAGQLGRIAALQNRLAQFGGKWR
jgi:hypothetical protein